MPWNEVTTMSLRKEFLLLAQRPGANLSELCRRFGISRKTAYKWIRRFEEGGEGKRPKQQRTIGGRGRPHPRNDQDNNGASETLALPRTRTTTNGIGSDSLVGYMNNIFSPPYTDVCAQANNNIISTILFNPH